jgi:hypothetical protein
MSAKQEQEKINLEYLIKSFTAYVFAGNIYWGMGNSYLTETGSCKENLNYYHKKTYKYVILQGTPSRIKSYLFLCKQYNVEPENVEYAGRQLIILDKKSFWRKSKINLEVLYSILKTQKPKTLSFANLAVKSPYQPRCKNATKILEALFTELPKLTTDSKAVGSFLKRGLYGRGFQTGLSEENRRKKIGLSI